MKKSNMASCFGDKLVALALQNRAIALLLAQQKKRRSTRVNDLWKERESRVHYHNLFQEMRLKDHSKHFNYLRMLPSISDDLIHLVGPLLIKGPTNFRKPLPPELRVAVA